MIETTSYDFNMEYLNINKDNNSKNILLLLISESIDKLNNDEMKVDRMVITI